MKSKNRAIKTVCGSPFLPFYVINMSFFDLHDQFVPKRLQQAKKHEIAQYQTQVGESD